MKQFRWGDVVPGCSEECLEVAHELVVPVGHLHQAAVHGIATIDPEDVGAVHPPLTLAG